MVFSSSFVLPLPIVAMPPLIGSLFVLAIATVGVSVWIAHLLAICIGVCLVFVGNHFCYLSKPKTTAFAIIILTLLGLATPLLGSDLSEPERWVAVGPISLYIAPFLLPSFIAALSVFVEGDKKNQIFCFAAVLVAALVLALQPDASQVLALSVASAIVVAQRHLGVFRLGAIVLPLTAVAIWAFSMPDPLAPVPYVEEVFALALSHSVLAGVAVIASAVSFIVGLWLKSLKYGICLSAVAGYYLVLFVCSTSGITPAPLIGYGAGPIMGFGLLIGMRGWLEQQDLAKEVNQSRGQSRGQIT